MSGEPGWRVAVVTFGVTAARTSTLGHLATPSGHTLCGAVLAASTPAPESFIRCQRCIDARGNRAEQARRPR